MLTRIGLVLRRWRRSYGLRWEFVALAILGVSLAWTLSRLGQPETPPLPAPVALAASTPQPRPTAAPTTARPVATATPTLPPPPTPVAIATLPVAPYPGGAVYTLTPAANAVGWVSENDARFNNFGDYNIYAGIFDGNEHVGAFQIDLSPIPPGAPILYADLTLAGLSDRFRGDQGTWTVEILPQELDQGWTLLTFGDLAGKVGATIDLRPTLAAKDIALGQYNTLVFDAIPLQALAQRTLSGHISFRVLGPTGGGNNLVAWDSGYGSRSRGRAPLLRVVAGPAPDKLPDTPTPNYIIITSTPTPENVVTQAAQAATATYQAMMEGTPTRLPRNWVTPIIVVPTETPANAATAEWHIEMATAQAYFGTPTLYPPNVWTATPIPPTPEPTWTRAPVYILVAPVASPANVVTAAALARAATAQAERFGTPTPGARLVPIRVITNTPTPGNEATADWQIRVATAEAFLFGTSVPSSWLQTATPIPPWLAVTAVTPTPT
ncbi:MAG: hypothetical protein KIT87_23085, partial [Anaerolineae bacterium]|nr:hypothetical protein [Anaerolineae bacterium]